MNWIIGHNCFPGDNNTEKMRKAAENRGHTVHWVKYSPIEYDKHQNLGLDKTLDVCGIGYGSIQFCKMIQRATKWTPGVWIDWERLKLSHYMNDFVNEMIHKDFVFTSLGDFIRRKDFFYKILGNDNGLFIKPDGNDKSFAGEVLREKDFDGWHGDMKGFGVSSSTMILVSSPVQILREWRTVVFDREFLTGSLYKKRVEGELSVEIESDCPADMIDYVNKVAGDYDGCRIYCLDVAQTIDGFRVVEIGSINCCGLYDCDIDLIVEKASVAAKEEFEELNSI